MHQVLADLQAICLRHVLPVQERLVVPEPYVPFIPEEWNGILVLAEAQNLSDPEDPYVKGLVIGSLSDRIMRLFAHDYVAVQPWLDGTLQLAMTALFGESEVGRFGVSNAVPWSLRAAPGRNANPDGELIEAAKAIWAEMFDVLRPETVVACGAVARDVVGASYDGRVVQLRSPSPTSTGRLVNLFDTDDLLLRYPEVRDALQAHPWIRESYLRNKIFFAAHTVSIGQAS